MAFPRIALASLVGCTSVLTGCTSVLTYQRPLTDHSVAKLQSLVSETNEVSWSGGTQVRREQTLNLALSTTEARWTSDSGEKRVVPVEALQTLRWTSHAGGAAQGVLLGAAAVFVITMTMLLTSPGDVGYAAFVPYVAAIPGAFLGGLVGAVVGNPVEVQFLPPPAP